ncbi:unnamed protein product, partial [marine sediment metagenome]
MGKLNLNKQKIAACRKHAKKIADDLQVIIDRHTTVSIERAILRLFGVDGVNRLGVPYPNVIGDRIKKSGLLQYGIANVIAYMMTCYNKDFEAVTSSIAQSRIKPSFDKDFSGRKLHPIMKRLCRYGITGIEKSKRQRQEQEKKFPMGSTPWLYA